MNQKKSIKNIIMHGGILAMAGIFVRIIGLVYRIPMVNIISLYIFLYGSSTL